MGSSERDNMARLTLEELAEMSMTDDWRCVGWTAINDDGYAMIKAVDHDVRGVVRDVVCRAVWDVAEEMR